MTKPSTINSQFSTVFNAYAWTTPSSSGWMDNKSITMKDWSGFMSVGVGQ